MMTSVSINGVHQDMEERDARARRAGHILYQSVDTHVSTTHSNNVVSNGTGPVRGATRSPQEQNACCGTMYPVRRTFILFVLFDLSFTFILWVIYTQVTGITPISQAFIEEVHKYTIANSLFDTVLCAAWRFFPLILAYALFRIRSPWVVALTTCGTCVFLLVKVFLFNFSGTNNHNNPLCYALLLVSFIIAWIETWFLDFKVLPQEKKNREREAMLDAERAPLLGDGRITQDYHTRDQYYSPVDSREGSDDEGDFRSLPGTRGHSRNHSRGSIALSLGEQEQEYIKMAKECWEIAWSILKTEDGWKLEAGQDKTTGCVHSRSFPKYGKVFRLEGRVDTSPQELFEELVIDVNNQPKWNPTLKECRSVQMIDDCTDITYNVAAEAAGGLVSSRDFVNLRHWDTKDGIILSCGKSVSHPDVPPIKQCVRGENSPGGWIFIPVEGEPNKCQFVWIMNTDLKGWIPQYAVDQALSTMLLDYLNYVHKRVADKEAGRV